MRIYLDHNATAPLGAAARDAMLRALAHGGNPSSPHQEGRAARHAVTTARLQVARAVGVSERDAERCVVFTSGATEANRLMLSAATRLLVSAIEHPSVAGPARRRAATLIAVDPHGRLDLAALATALSRGAPGAWLSVIWGHNELGVIQDVAALRALTREHGARLHLDATQVLGRLPIDFAALGCDALSVSSHKIGGPQGAGALVLASGVGLSDEAAGHQERGRRPGTENVPALVGFGAACEALPARLAAMPAVAALRDRLLRGLSGWVQPVVSPAEVPTLPNTLSLRAPGVEAEGLVMALDLAGVAVSQGAACSSGSAEPSPSLLALGLDEGAAREVFRVSLGPETTAEDIEEAVRRIARVLGHIAGGGA